VDVQLRESRLRKAGIAGRARMASELRDMDEDVSSLSRTLAVRTLQLEMEYIFSCLEDEALDIAQDLKGAGYLLLRCAKLHACYEAETSSAAKCVCVCASCCTQIKGSLHVACVPST
jgi:hypothetical protein